MPSLKNFKWFDKAPTADTARQPGALSIIGNALQGIAAPFAAAHGNNFGAEQMRLQQQRDEADQEFRKYLMQKNIQTQELGIKQKSDNLNTLLMAKVFGVDPAQLNSMISGQGTTPGAPPMSTPQPGGTPGMVPGVSLNPVSPALATGGGAGLSLKGITGGKVSFGLDPTAQSTDKTLASQKLEASQSVARDASIFNMMSGIMGDMKDVYNTADKEGFAGDILKAGWGNAAASGFIPKGMTDKMSQEGINAVGKFTAIRNEALTRFQPILSEQFGKEGSNRIMESLLKLADKEFGKLENPRASFAGRSTGTLRNLYRFTKASADYASKLGVTSDAVNEMDLKKLNSFVSSVLGSKEAKLTAEEDAYFKKEEAKFMLTPEQAKKLLEQRRRGK